jgi:ABC-type glycerol-3-phosphate transport system substrate-binding protein
MTWVLLYLLGVGLPGCEPGTPSSEAVTITFSHGGDEGDYYQALVQEFNQSHPYIAVELQGPAAESADVFVDVQYPLSERRTQDGVLSLDAFIERDESFDLDDFYPGTVDPFTGEGKTWAIPARVDALVTFYNQDLFDQYAVGYPEVGWTWDGFLSVASAIRDPEAGVFGYATSQEFYTVEALLFIYQHGGSVFDDWQNPTRATFDAPLNVEALAWYADLIYAHNVAPTPEQVRSVFGTGGENVYRATLEDRVGMWLGFFSGRMQPADHEALGKRWGMAPLPRDAVSFTMGIVEGYFISDQAQHPDACWQWVAFLSHQVPGRFIPVRRSVAESVAYERRAGGEVAAVARASIESAGLPSPEIAAFEGASGILGQAIDDIVHGRSTPVEAMAWAQRESENWE